VCVCVWGGGRVVVVVVVAGGGGMCVCVYAVCVCVCVCVCMCVCARITCLCERARVVPIPAFDNRKQKTPSKHAYFFLYVTGMLRNKPFNSCCGGGDGVKTNVKSNTQDLHKNCRTKE
jgi:hypothetical protein